MKEALRQIYESMGISPQVYEFGERIWDSLKDRWQEIDAVSEYNQLKVIGAVCLAPPATAIMTWGGKPWKKYMRIFFIRRTPWCGLRLPVVPMPWPWL